MGKREKHNRMVELFQNVKSGTMFALEVLSQS